MPRYSLPVFFLILGFLAPGVTRADDQPSPTELRMREALRSTMLQLRDAQNQMIGLQAQEQQSEKDKADLQAKIDDLTGRLKTARDDAAAAKLASDKTLASLKLDKDNLVIEMVNTLSIEINLLNKAGTDDPETLKKAVADMASKDPELAKVLDQYGNDIQLWKTGYDEYVQLQNKTEAERTKLAADDIMLQRTVEDRESKNLVLYNTATEILDRYEKFSLGEALSAKEPFIGLARVKLQEQVQNYKDKLLSEKLRIGEPPTPAPAPPASSSAAMAKNTKP